MPKYDETRFLPYDAAKLFHIVADVERYPEFLPWCMAVKVIERSATDITAEFSVKRGPLKTKLTSRVTLDYPSTITARHLSGPLSRLHNFWTFAPQQNGCLVHYHADFEMRSLLMQAAMRRYYDESIPRMVALFEARAHALFRELNYSCS